MAQGGVPWSEEERLRTLYSFDVLDSVAEERFDAICRLATIVCNAPVAVISLLDRDRQWFKARVGLDLREAPRENSPCAHAAAGDDVLVIEDLGADQRFARCPLAVADPRLRFFAGEPLRAASGHRLGALCVLDTRVRTLSPDQLLGLRTLAHLTEGELELRRLNLDMVRVDQARERLSQFAMHDLASPVTAIGLAAGDLRRRAQGAAPLVRLANVIDAAVDTMQHLIEDLRDLGVRRAGALAPRWQRVNPGAVVERVVAMTAPRLRTRGQRLDLAIDDGPEVVEADPHLVSRLLHDLVVNAIDVSPEGGRIEIGVARDGDEHYRIRVDDDGPGVPPEQRTSIFELYPRGSARDDRVSRGNGLAFCRAVAEVHGGTIEVLGREPRGSSFVVRLPLHRH